MLLRSSMALACMAFAVSMLVPAAMLPQVSAGEEGRIYLPPPGSRIKNPPLPRDDSLFVSSVYSRFLHREPTASELSDWRERLRGGLRRPEMVLEVMDPDRPFIDELFKGFLGRVPLPAERADLEKALDAGRPRGELIEAVLNSREYRKSLSAPRP